MAAICDVTALYMLLLLSHCQEKLKGELLLIDSRAMERSALADVVATVNQQETSFLATLENELNSEMLTSSKNMTTMFNNIVNEYKQKLQNLKHQGVQVSEDDER